MAKKTHFPPFCKFEPRQLRKKHGDPPLSLQVLMCQVPPSQNAALGGCKIIIHAPGDKEKWEK